jgi:phosphohistidine phosphatase
MWRLVVVRHAKSAWPHGVPDQARPLGPRGASDAPRMGRRIGSLVERIDLAVISPATRAQQTWALLGLEEVGEVRTDPRVYRDFGAHLPEVVSQLPGEASTVLLLGHEPGLSRLVLTLADRARPELRDQVATKFPTCAVAVLGSQQPWSEVGPGGASLMHLTTPRL